MRSSPNRNKKGITRETVILSLKRGLLLPIRLYFQPRTVYEETAQIRNRDERETVMWLTYLFAHLWLVMAYLITWMMYGRLPLTFGTVGLPLIMLVIGGMMATGIIIGGNAPEPFVFDFARGVAIGIVLNVGIIFYTTFVTAASQREGVEIALAGNEALSSPASFIKMGIVFGLMYSIIVANWMSPKATIITGLILSVFSGVCAVLVIPPSAESLTTTFIVFIIFTAIMTHLLYQPIHLVISLISTLIMRSSPHLIPHLWRISPARWSEFAYMPLIGLRDLLIGYQRMDAAEGIKAVNHVKRHAFYKRIGERVSKKIYAARSIE